MPFVSVTRLRVRSWRYLPIFLIQALRAARQAKRAEGNLSVSVLRQPGRTFWTRTTWISEDAMRVYMLSGVHRGVMRRLLDWCDEAALVHWVQESQQPPAWSEAHRQLQETGRTSKVNHPSQDHRAGCIPPLHTPVQGEITLK